MATADIDRAKKLRFFRNGDPTFTGKDVVVSSRSIKTWDNFLQSVTTDLGNDEAVRSICTPVGGTPIYSLNQLQDRYSYVAVGRTPFKNIGYLNLSHRQPPKFSYSPRFHRNDDDFKHVERSTLMQNVPGRLHEDVKDAVHIYVYANGRSQEAPTRVVIPNKMLNTMDSALKEVNARVHLSSSAVRSLYTLDGEMIHHPDQLENKAAYVAVGTDFGGFKRVVYGQQTKPTFYVPKKFDYNHRWWNENDPPPETRRMVLSRHRTDPTPAGGGGKASSVTSTGSDTTDRRNPNARKSFPSNLNTRRLESTNEHFTPRKSPAVEHRAPGPFLARPSVEVQPGATSFRVVDYDKDDGGVFKSKQVRRETRGAAEIRDSRETRIDVPVDHLPARQIDDEEIEGEYGRTPRSKSYKTSKTATNNLKPLTTPLPSRPKQTLSVPQQRNGQPEQTMNDGRTVLHKTSTVTEHHVVTKNQQKSPFGEQQHLMTSRDEYHDDDDYEDGRKMNGTTRKIPQPVGHKTTTVTEHHVITKNQKSPFGSQQHFVTSHGEYDDDDEDNYNNNGNVSTRRKILPQQVHTEVVTTRTIKYDQTGKEPKPIKRQQGSSDPRRITGSQSPIVSSSTHYYEDGDYNRDQQFYNDRQLKQSNPPQPDQPPQLDQQKKQQQQLLKQQQLEQKQRQQQELLFRKQQEEQEREEALLNQYHEETNNKIHVTKTTKYTTNETHETAALKPPSRLKPAPRTGGEDAATVSNNVEKKNVKNHSNARNRIREVAATQIQAAFKGYNTRKQMGVKKQKYDESSEEITTKKIRPNYMAPLKRNPIETEND